MAETHSDTVHRVAIIGRKWLSENTFELRLKKPAGFAYLPGQKIFCSNDKYKREYSLVSAPGDSDLAICIRRVHGGRFSSYLAEVEVGKELSISNGFGFFMYQKGDSVFVATGTGVAPFVSYARSGARDFLLLHGVTTEKELYYSELLAQTAKRYIPCLSLAGGNYVCGAGYRGRVTDYLLNSLTEGKYNFYLCGNSAMILDAVQIIDRKFPDSRVFQEIFFSQDR